MNEVVTRDGDEVCIELSRGYKIAVTVPVALALARDLRNAADPWSMEQCIEWMQHRSDVEVAYASNCRKLRCNKLNPHQYLLGAGWNPEGAAKHMVHDLAAKVGEPCPLGDLCPVCHPPAPPIPTDEEFDAMTVEQAMEWIEQQRPKWHVDYISIWSRSDPSDGWRCWFANTTLTASSAQALAKRLAARLREEAKANG